GDRMHDQQFRVVGIRQGDGAGERVNGTSGEFGSKEDAPWFPVLGRRESDAGADDQHWAGDGTENLLGKRASEELVKALASMRAEDDKIGGMLSGQIRDHFAGRSVLHYEFVP